jgi:predicted dehydrogenase
MVKQARYLVQSGAIGKLRKIMVQYPQGWLSEFIEGADQKQAAWRTDPSRSGVAGSMGDIGTHAENLAEYVSGLKITEMCADISIFVEGRRLDDDGSVLLRFEQGAKGILSASQVSCGEENDLRLDIYGDKGGLSWRQMEPNSLVLKWPDRPMEVQRSGMPYLSEAAAAACRLPSGHPEGYIEAFANIYKNVAHCIKARKENRRPEPVYTDFPTVEDGLRGMEFIHTVIHSGKTDQKWVEFGSFE